MIIDRVKDYKKYHFGHAWEQAFVFLNSLTSQVEDKKYEIDGDDIFAIVMSYQTVDPKSALFESHEQYVDIQTVIVGEERFECSFIDDLVVHTPYSQQSDAQFYRRTKVGQTCVDVTLGTFVMLYPHDAHMPGLMVGDESKLVKKVVVKIKKELLS